MSDFKCIFCQQPVDHINFNSSASCTASIKCFLYQTYMHFNKENKLIQVTFHGRIKNDNYWFWYYENTLIVIINNRSIEIKLSSPFQVIFSPQNIETKLPTLLTFS